ENHLFFVLRQLLTEAVLYLCSMNNKIKDMEKQTIIIGDVHGLTYWKEVVKDNPNCRYVFLGDYLDPYQPISCKALISNLKKIIQLKKKHPDDVVLLLGNHDLHYFTSDMDPSVRFDFEIAEEASELFLENIDLFQYAHQEANTVFTHAG
ncbi:metallophosphoesterase, partial [Candidatus Symbiothrix dinenymphae]|uniref:metallophosphoesterase n=1 Tax=Candidatus Symbiothrix dinenymphae TaxID=467085 RepID=UPI000A870819